MSEYRSTEGSSVRDYFARFDWALQLSKISEVEHHNYARVHMGSELNTALKILVSPQQPQELTYGKIKEVLFNHFDGKKNLYAESFKFRQIRQNVGESLATFSLRLKQAATACDYGAFLDRMLIEQMIFGVESRLICDEVIARQPKNFAEAYEIASSKELTQSSANVVKTGDSIVTEPTCKLGFAPVKTKNDWKKTTISNCTGCGGQHVRKNCKFQNSKCFVCGKVGHISKVCKSKINQVVEPVESDEYEAVKTLQQVAAVKTSGVFDRKIIAMNIEGQKVEMELDTGGPCSIISMGNLKKLKGQFYIRKSDRQFSSYTVHRSHNS